MKRGTSGLCGVLAIDKPAGITSHDVVDRVRRITGERRVGHAGTLDPMATGLMLVGVGAATRLSTYLTGHDKSYVARVVFGVSTDTDDASGHVFMTQNDSLPGECAKALSGVDPVKTCAGLVGAIDQLPPAYSAIKKNGIAAYKAAREGKAIELETRPVTIYVAQFLGMGTVEERIAYPEEGEEFFGELVYWDIALHVSKGTYIRSIARDLGAQFGCGAHLGALRRTTVSDFSVEQAHSLDELAEFSQAPASLPWCDPVALLGFPSLCLNEQQKADVANGRSFVADEYASGQLVSCVSEDKLLAVYESDGDRLKPATVIPGGVTGVA